VIYDVSNGIKITLAFSLVRNNIIYRNERLNNGILVGWSASNGWLSQFTHGVGITVANNTIVGAQNGTAHYTGWNLRVIENVFVDVESAHHLQRNAYAWYPDSWPGVVGEWVYADLTAAHPYYDYMPVFLQEMAGEYRRVEASGNVYPARPELSVGVESDFYHLAGTTFSEDHRIVDSSTLRAHMLDPEANDYRRDPADPGPLDGVGSGVR
jgi:hypothetical protein